MFDSDLPENMWDLALEAAVYTYNRLPHRSNEMIPPITKFNSDYRVDFNPMKRFWSLAYFKIQRKTGPKFSKIAKRAIHVGYKYTDMFYFV